MTGLFACGTLMTAEGLRPGLGARVDAFRFRPARLPGWRRVWNTYREEWLGGVLNVEPVGGPVGTAAPPGLRGYPST